MSIITKVTESLSLLRAIVAFAEKIKTILGVSDNDELTAKLQAAEAVLTVTQEALSSSANPPA